ncbi:DHH family phosphoesterase [Candidatus Haliotispira prima]|uniref:DHH family phosphoesterase n=1 Tax=Candidatus Haliotispira prima TaxID=3034016 RepID=A0ABY8MFY9_9SPIO|nr:DHH family phosphoesterase [Candidatus Haliotispira prima]
MTWHKEDLEENTVRDLSKALELDVLLSSVFARRGCTDTEELLYYLEKNERYLHNPFLLHEMDDAAERTLTAIDEGEQILIFGDRDVDGVSSTAILYHGLLELGTARECLQFRNPTADDAYGLVLSVVEEAAEQGVTLILTADCGCANHTEIAAARELGIDVIVLDHHTPKEERPLAYALVNPHSLDGEGPRYPFSGICAAGVSGKFLWALAYMKEQGQSEGESRRLCLLDIVVQEAEPKVLVRAAKLQNLCVQSRLELEIKSREDAERLYHYLQNEVLCSFTALATRAALSDIYGGSSDIYLLNLCDELLRRSPGLAERLRRSGALANAGQLRRELLALSRLARYRKLDFFDSQVELLISMLSRQLELPQKILAQSLDLMAMACIADMMPLQNENRIIVELGLRKISRDPRPGLRELLLELGLLGQELSARELSWKVIPVLNAAGRMGNTGLVTSLLTADSSDERRVLARQLMELNQERREQSEKFLALAQEPARKSFEESQGQLVYVAIPELLRGITGLIAGRLSRQYGGVPCVVTVRNPVEKTEKTEEGEEGEESCFWSGSLRSSGDPSVLSLLDPLADWFRNYGGHQAAGGFSVSAEKQKDLWQAFLSLLPLPKAGQANQIAGAEGAAEPGHIIDAEIPLEILNQSLLERLWTPLSPYGMEWPELLLLSRNLLLEDVQPIGADDAGHLRLILRPGNSDNTEGKGLNAVFWRSAERYLKDFTKGDIVDILYHIQANYYQGQMRFQLEIIDIRRHVADGAA